MRIAIVCATYVQGKSYQENIWAEQLAKLGHTVRAFIAAPKTGDVTTIDDPRGRYETQPVRTRLYPRSTFWSTKLPSAVASFKPDLIVLLGDKTIAVPLARDQSLRNVPLISTFSENLAMHEFDWRKRGITLKQRLWALSFAMSRGWAIRIICRRSAVVVGNTPQARAILSRLFRKREWPAIEQRMIDMPLGFSPEHFKYEPAVRRRVREELGIAPNDVVVIATSHFGPAKEASVRLIINATGRVMPQQPQVKGLIVGFSDQPAYAAVSARLGEAIDAHGHLASRYIRQPFAQRDRLCELYNAADIAVFNRASISCQEALGTGLVCCFANDGSLNHLITMEKQGAFFQPGNESDLAEALSKAAGWISPLTQVERDQSRNGLAEGSRWLSYDRIIADILSEVDRRRGAATDIRT